MLGISSTVHLIEIREAATVRFGLTLAMNYDHEVPTDWATWAPSPLNEPDCSPHSFDVMAIYALYQAVSD